jgi:predicted RND superfamily exporter protein
MKKFAKFIANHSILILVISFLLLVPAIYGYVNTRINYDILVYLPDSVDTIKGENILTDDFGLGAYAFVMVDSSNNKKMLDLEKDIKKIEGVNAVVSIADATDTLIPIDMLPTQVTEKLNKDNETIIMVTFDGTTSEDVTIDAVRSLREVVGDATKVSSMTSMVIDTMDLSNKEIFAYVTIAVILCLAVLFVATDSYVIPFFLLGNIGFAIIYNMGSNIFLGQISYITQAITAVLQLGVTMDFSIFLYHKYEQAKLDNPKMSKQDAMASAIVATFQSVLGSSLTTFAGFLALCTMDLTLGTDIGIVMAKGVLCGLICVLTLFPALLMVGDKLIDKTKHKVLLPEFKKLQEFSTKHYKGIIIAFLILLIPAYYGNKNYDVYYKLDESLPKDLAFNVANSNLAEKFNIVSPEIILLDKDVKTNDVKELIGKLENIEGIDLVLAPSTFMDPAMAMLLPSDLNKMMDNDKYQLIIVNSTYEIASDELASQIEKINNLVKSYDKTSIIAGEGPLMNDLVTIADHDFRMVNYTSILVIFIIMILVLKQINLPIILILTIEFAIFCNMSVAFYTNTTLPFIASIVVGTIQLGATIDYAILMSTKYMEERQIIKDKKEAMLKTLSLTVPSIITSALCFFAATFGVAFYTKIDMIGSICELLSRGAIISSIVVILILPSLLMVCDKFIVKNKKEGNKMKNLKTVVSVLTISALSLMPFSVNASKTENVYTNMDYTGTVKKTTVSNHLENDKDGEIKDNSILTNILNVNGSEDFTLDNDIVTWYAKGKDIFYTGITKKAQPINVVTKYYLNGKVTKATDMIGKSGKIKIEISLLNNSLLRTDNTFTPYVVALGAMMDSDTNTDISITNGKVTDTGTRSVLLAISAPGLYEYTNINEFKSLNKVTITYNTTDFEINDIYMVASPKILSELDLGIFDKLDILTSSISTLGEKMDELEAGTKDLANGTSKLFTNSSIFNEKLATASASLEKIANGTIKLVDGVDEMLTTLTDAKTMMEDKDIDGSLANLKVLQAKNEATITKLTKPLVEAAYKVKKMSPTETETEMIARIKKLNPNLTVAEEQELKNFKSTYELKLLLVANNDAVKEMITNLEDLNSLLDTLTTKLEDVKEMQGKVTLLNASLNELSVGLNKLSQASTEINKGISTLNNGATKISLGTTQLNNQGIKTLVNYSNRIITYSEKIENLVNLSKSYKGFASNNADSTLFVYKLSK